MPSFVLSSGSCADIQRLSEGSLLVVNVIGGLCLGISSYLQQLCTSPTHDDISSEMAQYGDVYFGACFSSVFRRMAKRKAVFMLWLVFLITSLPIHLLLNGSIGTAPTFISPSVAAVGLNMSSEYVVGDQLGWVNVTGRDCHFILYNLQDPASSGSLNVSNITVIVDTTGPSITCNLGLTPDYNLTIPPSWNQSQSIPLMQDLLGCNLPLSYCLTETVEQQCGLMIRWLPALIFSVALVLKAIAGCFGLYLLPHFKKRLYTNIGDFIYFAVQNPEYKVPNESLCSKRKRPKSYASANGIEVTAPPKHKPWAWFLGISDWLTYVFWVAGVGGVWGLVGYNFWSSDSSFTWGQQDFGLTGAYGILEYQWSYQTALSSGEIFQAIVVSNLGQLLLSVAYLLFNNQITRLWQEREWRGFYRKTKIPRTASASGPGTRTARWLQLPYGLSALLIAVSICLHWIASQAIYFVESYGKSFTVSTLNLYIMPLPTIVFASMWTALILIITIIYLLPMRTVMPVMASSARVIMASCCKLTDLPPEGITWGAITDLSEPSRRKAGFASTASEIVEGEVYL
jgi:hypothetical protein